MTSDPDGAGTPAGHDTASHTDRAEPEPGSRPAAGRHGPPRSAKSRYGTSRTRARKRALDLLFEAEQRGVNVGELLTQRLADPVTEAPLPDYTAVLVRGVLDHWHEIDEALTTYSQWPLNRMPGVDRAVLRLGAWEVVFNDDVADGAAIDQAVSLVRDLSTDRSPRFVNGLLSRLSQVKGSLRQAVPEAASPDTPSPSSDEVPLAADDPSGRLRDPDDSTDR